MSNSTVNLIRHALGPAGVTFDLGVKASTHVYDGTLVAQMTSGGMVVPYSTASSDVCVGVAQHEVDNSAGTDGAKRLTIETKRAYAFTNGTSSDAFADTDKIGILVYATDDHTVAKTSNSEARAPVGFFMGFESDSKVRVFIDPAMARIVYALQTLTGAPSTATVLHDNIVASFG